jgi:hypothetical protein
MNTDRNKALLRLLRLMTEAEKESFKSDFGIGNAADEGEILKVIESLPRYEAVRAFLRAADATLVLLRDVFEILESFGIATKTTGCVFVLANPTNPAERTELVFSQQTVGAVSSWSPKKKWAKVSDPLTDLRTRWNQLQGALQPLLHRARPRHEEGDIDFVETYIQSVRTGGQGGLIRHPDRHRVDEDAQRVLRHFTIRLEQMVESLGRIPEASRPPQLTSILRDSGQVTRGAADFLDDRKGRYRYRSSRPSNENKPPDGRTIERYLPRRFVTDFDKFLEDLYALSDLIQGDAIADMLRIDVWSSRPQLFEIWVLLKLLNWIRHRGYIIELLRTDNRGADLPFRWNLSYAKDSKPCAVVRGRKGGEQFVFFQLFLPGDMPDISLLEGAEPSSTPVWSVDPKHAEKQGYSRSAYEETAIRYRDSFKARVSLIAEYFARPELGVSNPIEFGPGAKLILDCRPDGKGLPILLSELAQFHPSLSQVLVCIDFSGSFAPRREDALKALRQSVKTDDRVFMDECICFAGNAVRGNVTGGWRGPGAGGVMPTSNIEEGSAFEPLFAAIAEFKRTGDITEIVLVTDGRLDIPMADAIARIQSRLGLGVTVFGS